MAAAALLPAEALAILAVHPALHLVDVRGQRCPLPVLLLGKAVRKCGRGVFLVLATDPVAASDIPAFCAEKHWHVTRHAGSDGLLLFEVAPP